MIVSILTAFTVALFLEMLLLINKHFKQITIFISCLTIIFVYFTNGCQLNFIGKIDLTVWIMFVIIFDMALMFITKKIIKHIKE